MSVEVEVEVKDGLVNPVLKDQLLNMIREGGKESEIVLEQYSEFENRTYRLIYAPQVMGEQVIVNFIMGPDVTVEEQGDNEAFGPRYTDNVIHLSSVMFPSEDMFVNYVTNLWTSFILHSFFTNEFDPSYRLTAVAINAMKATQPVTFTRFESTNHAGVYNPENKSVAYVNPEDDVVLFEHKFQGKVDDRMAFVNEFMVAWETIAALDSRIVEIITENKDVTGAEISDKISELLRTHTTPNAETVASMNEEATPSKATTGEELVEEILNESEAEKEDEIFDIDGDLYKGELGNSLNPIDVSEPEVQEDRGCAGGGCTL